MNSGKTFFRKYAPVVLEFAAQTAAIYVGITFIGHEFGYITICTGPSMLPTINTSGDLVIVDRISQKLGRQYEIGDVVVATCPNDPRKSKFDSKT